MGIVHRQILILKWCPSFSSPSIQLIQKQTRLLTGLFCFSDFFKILLITFMLTHPVILWQLLNSLLQTYFCWTKNSALNNNQKNSRCHFANGRSLAETRSPIRGREKFSGASWEKMKSSGFFLQFPQLSAKKFCNPKQKYWNKFEFHASTIWEDEFLSTQEKIFKNTLHENKRKTILFLSHNTFFRTSWFCLLFLWCVYFWGFLLQLKHLHPFKSKNIYTLCAKGNFQFIFAAKKNFTGQLYRAFLAKNLIY